MDGKICIVSWSHTWILQFGTREKLDAINQERTPAMSAPGTKVYELIEKLKPYLKG